MTPPTEDRTVEQRLSTLEHEHGIPDAMKAAMKEALREWLDDKFMLVGKWTVNGVLATGLAALVYFILAYNGWKHDQ